jgi:hypothetical protein
LPGFPSGKQRPLGAERFSLWLRFYVDIHIDVWLGTFDVHIHIWLGTFDIHVDVWPGTFDFDVHSAGRFA